MVLDLDFFIPFASSALLVDLCSLSKRGLPMGLGLFLAFPLLALLVSLLVAQGNAICPKDFLCGNLGPMSFPFTNISRPDCGLCVVECQNRPYPHIKLDPSSDQVFEARNKIMNNSIKLGSLQLQRLLPEQSCSTFYYQIYLPNSSSVSFKISNSITLFRCTSLPYFTQEAVDTLLSKGYKRNTSCDGFQIFYRNPIYHPSQPEPSPPGCMAIHLPMRPRNNVSKESELFQLLSFEFDLEWHLIKVKKNESKIIILTVAAGGGFLIISLAIFLWCCKKRIEDAPFLRSRSELGRGNSYLGVPIFSYTELEEITNNFDASQELGDGGFGTVYYGKLHDGREVAVKRLYEHNIKRMEQFMNEVQILTRLKHKNLVSLHGCTSRHSRELLLVYEYIPNGTLADHLHGDRVKHKSLAWPIRMNIAIETASALAYLHASDIVHRDVKTNNILLDRNFHVKVADFGLSRLFPNDVSHISTAPQGTPGYVDPEYHHCYQLTDKSDVYSFGVVLVELISSMPAVDTSRNRQEINLAYLAVNRIQGCAFHELIDPSLGFESDFEVLRMTTSVAELAFRCLQLEKEMRPTMDEVLENLRAIQDCKDVFEETTETNANTIDSRSTILSFSPEPEYVVLLKRDSKIPSSPKSVTALCISSSTKSSASTSNP